MLKSAAARLRLAYLALAAAFVIGAVGIGALIERQQAIAFDTQYRTLQRTSEALTAYIESAVERIIADVPPAELEGVLQSLVDEYGPLDDVFNIRIARQDRVVVAALRRGNRGKPESLPLMLAALAGERGSSVEFISGVRNYCVAVPLVVDGGTWGAVILYRNLEPMYAAVEAAANALRWATLGTLALLLLGSGGLVMLAGRELRRRRDRQTRLALMGTMAASVAHEVRNPLNALALSLDWLNRRLKRDAPPSPDELAAELGTMHHQIARLEHVVRDFSDLARPPAIHAERVAFDTTVAHVFQLFAPLAGQRGVRLTAPPSGLEVEADPQRLEQVLVNLVKNALEATPAGGTVQVSAAQDGPRLAIEVADSGVGMEPAQRAALFEPFRSSRPNGMGLGLYVSKHLVEAHGGTLSAQSRPGHGTTFRIELPVTAGAA